LGLLTALAAVAAAAAVWLYLPLPKMTGYVIFHVSAQPQTVLTPVGDARADFTYYRQAQVALVKSRPVLNTALNQPEMANLGLLKGQSDPYAWLEKTLQIGFPTSQEFMRLSMEGDQSEEMVAVLEAVKFAYMREVVNKDKAKREARFGRLEAVQRKYGQELERYRNKLRKLTEGLGSGDPGSLALKEKFLQEQLGLTERELYHLRSDMRRAQIEARGLDEKAKGDGRVPDDAVVTAIKSDPAFQKLLAQRAQLRDGVEAMKKDLAPGARPAALVEREQQLEALDKVVESYPEQARPGVAARLKESYFGETKRSAAAAQDRLAFLKDLEKAVEKETNTLSERLQHMNIDQVNLESLKLEMAQTEKTADRIQQEMEAMRPEFEAPARVTVWEEPTAVSGIEGNRRVKYSLLAGFAVLALGLSLVTFFEYRIRRVVDPQEAAECLRLRLIGTVPWMPRLPAGAGSPTGRTAVWQSMLTEYVDAARTMLVHSFPAAPQGRTIMIASAIPGEGKTMLACQLACSLARAGAKTLLIDGDLRRPAVHRLVGKPRSPGLCEVLRGRARLPETIQACPLPSLSFLAAGEWEQGVGAALSTDRWRLLKTQLEGEFEYVVIDSSPALLVTDPLLLARHTDGVVLSVLRNVSQIGAAAEARDRFEHLGVRVLGVVVSGVDRPAYRSAFSYYQPRLPAASTATA
jgi:capsular exopolysaccharide synthesis family protein